MANTKSMTTGAPGKLLFSFALPLMFGNVFQQLYTVVDTAIVGRGVGMAALAALGTVDWLNWMLLGIAQGFTQGYSVRIAQKFGQQDYEGLKRILGASATLSVGIALAVTVLAQIGLPLFLTLLRVPENLRSMSTLYCRVIMGGFPAVMFFNFCSSCLRAVGDSKTPLYAMIAASIANIILDVVAVFVLDWGIAGAAAATVFSQMLSGAICAGKLWKTPLLRFAKRHVAQWKACASDLIRIGSPIAAKNIIIALGGMTIQTVVNGFPMSFIAGFTATNKLYGLLEIAAISYSYAVTTYVGQNFGAQQLDRIKSGIRAANLLSIVTSLVIACVMLVFGRQITGLFISQEDVVQAVAAGRTAYRYLCVMSFMLPMLYLLYVYQAALQGIGNSIATMISGSLEFVVRVTLAFVVAYTGYQEGIFIAEVSAWLAAAIFLSASYYRDMRKLTKRLCHKTDL